MHADYEQTISRRIKVPLQSPINNCSAGMMQCMEDIATCVNTCIIYRELYITHIHGADRKAQTHRLPIRIYKSRDSVLNELRVGYTYHGTLRDHMSDSQ